MTFQTRIKELRKNRGLTQRDIAEKLGVTREVLSAYENGYAQPSIEMLIKLADFYNVTTDFILARKSKLDAPPDLTRQLEKAYATLGRIRKEFKDDPDLLACYEPSALYLIKVLESTS